MGLFNNRSGLVVGDGIQRLFPVQPEVTSVFVGERHAEFFGFGIVPVNFLRLTLAFVAERVLGPLLKSIDDGHVAYAGFLGQFAQHRFVPVRIVGLHVPFWKVPVTLRVLEQQDGPVVHQNHTARGLHDGEPIGSRSWS